MEIKDLKEKLVAVLGYGLEGEATVKYLIKHGIKPVLFDSKPWNEWPKERQDEIKSLDVNFIFGPDYLHELKGFDVVFRSPGVRLSDLTADKSANYKTAITSQTKWFFDHCPAKIIGVTGTKGKGTTSTLIFEILKKNFQSFDKLRTGFSTFNFQKEARVYLTGNIGEEQPFDFLDELSPDDWVVYEMSSFQLQDLEISPHIGVVLMTTVDHLDHHKDIDEYREAKMPIVKFQSKDDFAVINADNAASMKIGSQGKGQKFYFSREKEVDRGCYIKGDQMVVKDVNGENFQFSIFNFQLRGKHNWENICAAVTAALLAGVSVEAVQSTIANFKGLEHRLEFVAEKNGVKFYNDSFSTTPETAIAAIGSFTEPEILILGGSSKGADFSELGKAVAESKNIRAVILTGQEAERIKAAIVGAGNTSVKIFEGATSMEEIFGQIASVAQSGDAVLLSPACASFGMFKNYKDRGEQFKFYVNKI